MVKKRIYFMFYAWYYSSGVVLYWYLNFSLKYKTYGNPVYITMVKN